MSARRFEIRTPEGVAFSWPVAGPIARFLAWSIDMTVLSTGIYFLQTAARAASLLSPDVAAAVAAVLLFVLQTGYSIVLEWRWRGQTIGKRVLNIRVVDSQGLRLHLSQIAIRNVLRFADSLPVAYAVGGVSCVLTARAQRLGDIAAGTVVIRHDVLGSEQRAGMTRLKYNSLRAYPHLAARLRQRTAPEEAMLAMGALARSGQLEAGARLAMFDELAEHFRAKVRFPVEALEPLGSEQYVRDVVDLLLDVPQTVSARRS